MEKRSSVMIISILLLSYPIVYSQNQPDTTRTFRVETTDGNVFMGYFVREDSVSMVFLTEKLGELVIRRKDIYSLKELKNVTKVGNDYWLPNPQSTRYYWAPNGYGLEEGSAYYQNIWVLYNQASVGLSKNFSLGAGMMPLFFFGSPATPLWVVPKFSFPVVKDKFNIGTGAFLGTLIGEESGSFGLLYGTTTFGSRDKNLSFGLAWGFAEGDWMKKPIINISYMARTGPKGYFISENYVIPYEGSIMVLLSLGGRSIIRNIGLDYSLWLPFGPDIDRFVAIPFLGITIPIGKKN